MTTTLSEDLKEWRKKMGWTQERAAEWHNVELNTYRGWEGGRRKTRQPGPIRERMKQATARKGKKPDPAQLSLIEEAD